MIEHNSMHTSTTGFHSIPPTGSTSPHSLFSQSISSVTAVGNSGSLRSGNGGVTIGKCSIVDWRDIWAYHCENEGTKKYSLSLLDSSFFIRHAGITANNQNVKFVRVKKIHPMQLEQNHLIRLFHMTQSGEGD